MSEIGRRRETSESGRPMMRDSHHSATWNTLLGTQTVPVRTGNEARALLVVSKDYGELGLAISLLRGQEFASRARVLLPHRLFSDNKNTLPVSASPYAGLKDVLGAIAAHEPDLVFLLSGYLLEWDRLLARNSLDTLVRHLGERGCRVLTSDPFLGLAPHVTASQIDTQMVLSGHGLWRGLLPRLLLRLQGSKSRLLRVPSLEHVVHLYPTSTPDSGYQDGVTRFSFFNPTLIRPAEADRGRSPGDRGDQRLRWLFILSSTDFHCQRALFGLSGFTRLVANLLQRTLDAGRHPTLIAPRSIVEILSDFFYDKADLLPFCPFAEFESRLLGAEYVFFWNAFSYSMLPRLANQLPMFVFDRGHLARTIEPFYQVALSAHFAGWVPAYLDQSQPLDPRTLADLAERQRLGTRAIRERWQSSPTPDDLVDRLVRDSGNRHESV